MPNHNNVRDQPQPGDYRPIALRNYASALVAALARLQSKRITVDIGPETWQFRFSAQEAIIAGNPVSVRGEWLGHRIVLWFPQVLLQRTLQICMPGLHATTIPPALFAAVAGNAVGAWLHALPSQESLRIDAVEDGMQMPAAATGSSENMPLQNLRLHLRAQCNMPAGAAVAAVDYAIAIDIAPALIAALPQLCESLPPDWLEAPPALTAVPLRLQCEIGRAIVPYATLHAMRRGDILFFDQHAEPDADEADADAVIVQLSHRRQALMRARIQQPDLMVITSIDMNDRKSFLYDDLANDSASDPFSPIDSIDAIDPFDPLEPDSLEPSNQAHADHPADNEISPAEMPGRPSRDRLSQMPLQVVFDVGSCEMSFDELRKIQPGAVIPLASRMPEVVRITVNGRTIASGELVEVDGKVGVMVASLADAR